MSSITGHQYYYVNTVSASTTVLTDGPAVVRSIVCGSATGTVTLYDQNTSSLDSSKIVMSFPNNGAAIAVLSDLDLQFKNGITILQNNRALYTLIYD
jgi:hypothetical protein